MKFLDCSYNQFSSTGIDISQNIALTELSCSGNQLKSLDISNNTALTSLYCEDNQLTNLDLSPCSGMWHLQCYNNLIASLDISNCPTLVYIVENLSPYERGDSVRYGGRENGWGSDDILLYCDKNVTLITDPENAVTISFDKNAPDAEGEMIPQPVNRGEEAILSSCGFTRKGYIFVGWNVMKDGGGKPYDDAGAITITEPVTLYAQWREGYNITFDKNAADASGNMKSLRVLKGDKTALTSNASPVAEFNVYIDAPAYDRMLNFGVPVTVIGLDVCSGDSLWTNSHFTKLAASGKIGRFVTYSFFKLREHFARNGSAGVIDNCDGMAMMCAVCPGFVKKTIQCHCNGVTDPGETYGQVIFYQRGHTYDLTSGDYDYNVEVVSDVDRAKFFTEYLSRVGNQSIYKRRYGRQ